MSSNFKRPDIWISLNLPSSNTTKEVGLNTIYVLCVFRKKGLMPQNSLPPVLKTKDKNGNGMRGPGFSVALPAILPSASAPGWDVGPGRWKTLQGFL